ncbi:transglutaminase-like domain-containing protein [archaeon]|nr:transglutaminase-like domain-containing protein [archaeon]
MKTLLLILLLLTFVQAQTLSVINAGSAEIELVLEGNAAENQTLYLPATNTRQKVVYPTEIETWKDEHENVLTNVTGNYSHTFHVTIDATKPLLFDEKYPPNKENQYLKESDFIEITPEVKSKAESIIGNNNSTLEAIALLTEWVYDNIEYNSSYSGIKTTKEILNTKQGVCSEYATMYTALARASGIPTRIITGIANTGSGWVRHAWAESLVSGHWIPIEPTYKEAGTRNALAVKLYSGNSYPLYLLPDSTEEFKIQNYSANAFQFETTINAKLSKTILAPEEMFYLQAEITNQEASTIMPSYMVQKNIGITSLDSFRKIVVIPPGKRANIEWEFIGPYGERNEYVLFFKGPGTEEKFTIKVDPNQTAQKTGTIEITEVFAKGQEEVLELEITIKNKGNRDIQATVRTITKTGSKSNNINLNAGEEKTINFSYSIKPGMQEYTVIATSNRETRIEKGTIEVTKALEPQQSLLKSLNQNLQTHPIYFTIIILVILGVIILLIHPRIKKTKKPFKKKHKSKWHRLVKIKKKKRP